MKSRIPLVFPLLFVVVVVVFVPIFVLITMDRLERQKEFFTSKLAERGASLIHTFEAGTRSGMFTMHWGAKRIQAMIQEISFRPEVKYVFIVSKNGRIVAHSDLAMVGHRFTDMPDIGEIKNDRRRVLNRIVKADTGEQVFEVYKRFVPMHDRFRNKHRMIYADPPPWVKKKQTSWQKDNPNGHDWSRPYLNPGGDIKPGLPEHYIFAGLSMQREQLLKARLLKETIFYSAVLFLLGCAGVAAIFAFQAYRSAKASLTNVKAFSDNVIQNMPSGLVTISSDYAITSMNHVAGTFFGQDLEKPFEEWIEILKSIDGSDKIVCREIVFEKDKEDVIPLELTASCIRTEEKAEYLMLFRDLTQIRELKKQVETNKRLAAIGKLAAGVAHEIRNPLSSIKGFATYFARRYRDDEQDHTTAMIMKEEVERINRSITQLLEFAKPLPVEKKRVNLKHLIDHSLKLVQHDFSRKKIEPEVSMDITSEMVLTDPDRINQVLLNLYINAIEALDEKGTLEVSLKELVPESLIEIRVRDNGTGIRPEDIDSVFDPYYTTKSSGTGLGLSIVHRIIEKLGGQIRVESTPGQGSCFIIVLPVSER